MTSYKFGSKLKNFRASERGSIGMTFGLTATALIAANMVAIEYNRAVTTKSQVQNSLDAAVMHLVKSDARTQPQDPGVNFLMETINPHRIDMETFSPEFTWDAENFQVSASATFELNSLVARTLVPGFEMKVESSAIPEAARSVDVMMALDYSGSMGWNNKYVDMANAANDFLNQANEPDRQGMQVGIVPFAHYVLTSLGGQFAFDVKRNRDLSNFSTIVGCTLNREHPHSVSDATPVTAETGSLWPVTSYTVPGGSGYSDEYELEIAEAQVESIRIDGTTYFVEYIDLVPGGQRDPTTRRNGINELRVDGNGEFAINPVVLSADGRSPRDVIIRNEHSTWDEAINALGYNSPSAHLNGYGDSDEWGDVQDTGLPANFTAHQLAEQLDEDCSVYADRQLWARPLSTQFAETSAAISAMRPGGKTNVALALDFAWHHLNGDAPFTGARSEVDKAVILLTDGAQTVKAHGGSGNYNINSANANIAESCEAMKADDIEIFAIAFAVDDEDTRELLSSCASNEVTHYHELESGGALDGVFDNIFETLTPVRARLTR